MGAIRSLPRLTVSSSGIVPAIAGILSVTAAVSFSINGGIAYVNLGAGNLPKNGYNGPQANFGAAAGGQQVVLWGFTTATYFNGKQVTVLGNDGSGTFWFAFNHANVASTNDAGNTAPVPFQHYRTLRIEVDPANSTDTVYLGDLNVSTSQYMAALTPAGQYSIDIASENIPAERVWLIASGAADAVHATLIY